MAVYQINLNKNVSTNNTNNLYYNNNVYSNRYWKTFVAFPNDSNNFFSDKNLSMNLQNIDSQISSMYLKNMSYMYNNCQYLTGSPLQTYYIIDMNNAYRNCKRINGTPYCGNYTTNMAYTYASCSNLEGPPVCGINVTNMTATYMGCSKMLGIPKCENNVTTMFKAYQSCSNISGCPVCGEKVTNMNSAYYECVNLIGAPISGNNVTKMGSTYYNCHNLEGNMFCNYIGSKNANSITMNNCFYGHNNKYRINIMVFRNYAYDNALYNYQNSYGGIVGTPINWTDMVNGYYNKTYNIYVYNNDMIRTVREVPKKIVITTSPTAKISSFIFNNKDQSISFTNYDSTTMLLGGTYTAKNAGTYKATLTPRDGYCWSDGSTTAKTFSWTINQKNISGATITLGAALAYNGSQQTKTVISVIIDGLTATYSVSGNTGIKAGSYTLTCTGTGNFTGTQTTSWAINKMSLSKPTLSNTNFTYDGTIKAPTISAFDSNYISQTGTFSTSEIGTHYIQWWLLDKNNTQWNDGTTDVASASWTITKTAGYITLSSTSGSVNKGSSITIIASSYSGSLSAVSSNTNIATCSVNGNTIIINGITSGNNATITITAAETDTYAAATITYSVYVNYVWARFNVIENCTYGQSTTTRTQEVKCYDYFTFYSIGACSSISGYAGYYDRGYGQINFNSSTGLFSSNFSSFSYNDDYIVFSWPSSGTSASYTGKYVSFFGDDPNGSKTASLVRVLGYGYTMSGWTMEDYIAYGEYKKSGISFRATNIRAHYTTSTEWDDLNGGFTDVTTENTDYTRFEITDYTSYKVSVDSYSKGSTQIDTISSATIDYPTDGTNDNTYWYVLQ